MDMNNYRPISLTSVVCKLMETIIRNYTVELMTSNDYLYDRQFGFIKGRTAVMQLLRMLDEWTEYIDSGGQIDCIYTDLEKAFDKSLSVNLHAARYSILGPLLFLIYVIFQKYVTVMAMNLKCTCMLIMLKSTKFFLMKQTAAFYTTRH